MNELLQRGPEIPAGTWEYDWFSSVVAKTAEFAGRASHWNGKLYEQPGQVSGIYYPDGSMTISREHVLDPARPAYTPGRTPQYAELSAAAGATRMAVYQARLSLSGYGADNDADVLAFVPHEDVALERGLADRFTERYGARIADELSEHPLPISSSAPAFPAFTTATDRLLAPLAGATGMGAGELRDLIERTEIPDRFDVIADRVIDHQVGDLVPETHRAGLREHLAGPLRRGLGGLAMTEYSELTHPGLKQTWGDKSAELTDVEFSVNLDDIKAHYESWNADNPGVEPPELPDALRETFLDRQEQVGQIWADAGWPAQQPAPGREPATYERVTPVAREQEIARLRQFLGSHTGPSQRPDPAVDATGRPDNVRQIGSARRPERGIE
ncbi:hypothetical protein ACFWUU_20415 [Kribbella sp. NPDC058693]|uniref:hypothetical protein n=1 Tax=Kribbella sp. NPDC058693 TaxID=3346602 RepID=UPI00365C31B0